MPLHSDFLTKPLAHRGLHDRSKGRIENTMASFVAAVDHGYGIELDVQLSADGRAMVFHDDHLDRLTAESGPVNQRTSTALQEIALKGSDDHIPTLRDVLAFVDGRVPVLIEIKDQDGALGRNIGPLENAVAGDLQAYKGPVAVMSFNPHAVAKVHDLAPDIAVGLVTCDFHDDPEWAPVSHEDRQSFTSIADFARVGASFISHDRSDLTRPRVAELKSLGAAVLCWTVRSVEQEGEARRVVDNITFESYLA